MSRSIYLRNTLKRFIILAGFRSNGYFNVEEFLRCLRKVNEAGVFHRDIKYLNIIFMHFKYHGE